MRYMLQHQKDSISPARVSAVLSGAATDLLDVPKQHCEPSLCNLAPSDGPCIGELDSMCSYQAQYAPLGQRLLHPTNLHTCF